MDQASEALLKLKPVTFRYKEELDPDKIPEFGLVAEDVEKVAPDLVVLTGDYVTRSAHFIHSCAPELARLRSRLGTLAILGNHDYWTEAGDITAALEREGIPVLVNRSVEAAPGFWVSGLDDSWAGDPDLHATLANVPPDVSPLMLTHNPHICDDAMVRPMLSEAVAAGEGAFSTWIIRSASTKRKSSTSCPFGSSAWARTPAPAG